MSTLIKIMTKVNRDGIDRVSRAHNIELMADFARELPKILHDMPLPLRTQHIEIILGSIRISKSTRSSTVNEA